MSPRSAISRTGTRTGWTSSSRRCASEADAEFQEYVASGHLFTDASRPDEFDPRATEALWTHVHDFLRNIPRAAHVSLSS